MYLYTHVPPFPEILDPPLDNELILIVRLDYVKKIWALARENLSSGFPTRSLTSQSVQLQRLATMFKFFEANLDIILCMK